VSRIFVSVNSPVTAAHAAAYYRALHWELGSMAPEIELTVGTTAGMCRREAARAKGLLPSDYDNQEAVREWAEKAVSSAGKPPPGSLAAGFLAAAEMVLRLLDDECGLPA
jgi:hypothetical protein